MVASGMRTAILLILSAAAVAGQAPPSDSRAAAALDTARRISTQLTDKIRALLMQELKAGGFAGAVNVCSKLAQKTTREFSARAGHTVRRVSLKYRNPDNAPDGYEAAKLAALARLHAEKRLPAETWEVVREGGRETLRYLKPILVLPMCLACHGPAGQIAPEVRSVLEKEYPRDRAAGYRGGELRGAVSVTVVLSAR